MIDTSLKDTNFTTTNAKDITSYTEVFKTRTMINGVEMSHAWDIDRVRYADNTIGVLWQARANWTGSDSDSTGLPTTRTRAPPAGRAIVPKRSPPRR